MDMTIEELEKLVARYQASYYNGEGEVSDAEFDALWDELKRRAPESPILARVGADDTDGFPKRRHRIPMGSQEKAADEAAFRAWAEKWTKHAPADDLFGAAPGNGEFIVQYKLDGASLELQYDRGKLTAAVTRGDGTVGDEITANARKMRGVIADLGLDWTGGVRGEVLMFHDVHTAKYADKANCRNAANGLMRRKDGTGSDDLTLIVYDVAERGTPPPPSPFVTEMDKITWLAARGFTVTETRIFHTASEIIAYRAEVAARRTTLPFDIDGLVVKCAEIDTADLERARPEKQIAFKFELEEAVSTLREVVWSESGATYTPIGIIDAVSLAGTTVRRASLNNPDQIAALGLRLGSRVIVVKRGEIIPKIIGLAPSDEQPPEAETTPITQPKKCAVCGSSLVDDGTRLYCPSPACPKRLHHRLEKWISVLDIQSIGDKLLANLFESGRVRHICDLYTLTAEEVAVLPRMGSLSAAKVVRHIMTPRSLSLSQFIAGFDFEGVAEITMDKVADAGFATLALLRAATVEKLAGVYGLGEITAKAILNGLAETKDEMDAVLAQGIITIKDPPADAASLPLAGLSFCFTGELGTMKRDEAKARVKELGGAAKETVTKDLSYLVTNTSDSQSSKNKKAAALGVKIINEETFLRMLIEKINVDEA